MAQDIKQTAEHCEACQRMKPHNQKEMLRQHSNGQSPWAKVGIDLFELDGRQYLVTVDYFSSFIEVDYLTSTTAKDVIIKLEVHFARYGIPSEIVSDQDPQFTSTQFHSMVNKWGIVHTMSSPGHHQSSGKTEAVVKTVKHMMYKCLQDGTDVYEALLELRNTPQQDTGLSPTQMTFGRLTRTRLPAVTNRPVNKKQLAMAQKRRTRRQQTVRQSYNRRARDLVPLHTGQPVYYQHLEGQRWRKGTVQSKKNERSYIIEGDTCGVYQRNRVHIRPTCIRNVSEPQDQTSD